MSDNLVEKVAKALARQAYSTGGMERVTDPYTPDAEYWDGQARVAIAAARASIRAEALDEAAMLADENAHAECNVAEQIAVAIRALKGEISES